MTKEQAIHLLEAALANLKAGNERAIQSLHALNALGIDLGGDTVTVDDISDANGVANGRNVQMIVNQVSISGELEAPLITMLDKLAQCNVPHPGGMCGSFCYRQAMWQMSMPYSEESDRKSCV